MPDERKPVAWIAPGSSLKLAWSPVLGEKVITVDGGMTFDMTIDEYKIACVGYEGEGGQCFDIEIISLANPGDNLVICLSAANMEKFFCATSPAHRLSIDEME